MKWVNIIRMSTKIYKLQKEPNRNCGVEVQNKLEKNYLQWNTVLL